MSGVGVSGAGVSGVGVSGIGVSGDGVSGVGVSGILKSGAETVSDNNEHLACLTYSGPKRSQIFSTYIY